MCTSDKLLPGRVPGSTVDRLRARSSAGKTGCLHSYMLFRLHTNSFSNKRLWTGCSRGEALTSAGKTGCLRRATPSLRDARRHVTHVCSATV